MANEASDGLPAAYRGREQTYVKHLVLRDYLERVAWNILSFKDDFAFIDGFSGPWMHANDDYSDTSFGIAIDRLRMVKATFAKNQKTKSMRCVFVEKRTAAFQRLSTAAASAKDLGAIALSGAFEDRVNEIERLVGSTFSLTFVDPTGWSFDLKKLAPLFRHRSGEVLINFMYEHFRRFIDDKRPEIRQSQNLPFGDESWRDAYDELIRQDVPKEEAVLTVFKDRVKSVCGFKYVASARIQNPLASKTHFHLVYGTHHPKGLVEFRRVEKDAMRLQEQCKQQARADALLERTGQVSLFPAFEVAGLAGVDPRQADRDRAELWILGVVGSAVVRYYDLLVGALQRFSLTEPELKDTLVGLRDRGLVVFHGMKPRQKKPDENVSVGPAAAAA